MQEGEGGKRKCLDETYIRPKEAARKLRAAREMKKAAYLYGATGIGKTTLVEDILNHRRYKYYSAQEAWGASSKIAAVNEAGKRGLI